MCGLNTTNCVLLENSKWLCNYFINNALVLFEIFTEWCYFGNPNNENELLTIASIDCYCTDAIHHKWSVCTMLGRCRIGYADLPWGHSFTWWYTGSNRKRGLAVYMVSGGRAFVHNMPESLSVAFKQHNLYTQYS